MLELLTFVFDILSNQMKRIIVILSCVLIFVSFQITHLLGQTTNIHYEQVLLAVKDSMQLNEQVFAKAREISLRYHKQMGEIQGKKFNQVKNKLQAIKTLKNARRTELIDVFPKKIDALQFAKLLITTEQKMTKERQLDDAGKAALNELVQSYNRSNIAPFLVEQRSRLESLLNEPIQKELSYLRTHFGAIQESMIEKRKECMGYKGDNEAVSQCKQQMKALTKQLEPHKKQINELWAKIKNGSSEVQQIFEENEQKRKFFKKELEAIIFPHFEGTYTDTSKLPIKADKFLVRLMPVNFLLLDAERLAGLSLDTNAHAANEQWVYYNPQQQKTYFNYVCPNEEALKVDLFDFEGNYIGNVLALENGKGSHQLPLEKKGRFILRVHNGQKKLWQKIYVY